MHVHLYLKKKEVFQKELFKTVMMTGALRIPSLFGRLGIYRRSYKR